MSWIAEYDTHGREFPTCVHVTKTTNSMTHGATYVPIEDGKAVRDENAKLRRLAQVLIHCLSDDDGCDTCPVNGNPYDVSVMFGACDELHNRITELGIEVK